VVISTVLDDDSEPLTGLKPELLQFVRMLLAAHT
jgi:hypothetical protein